MTTATTLPKCAIGPEDSGALSSAIEVYLLGITLAGEPLMQHAVEPDELEEVGAKLMLAARVLRGLSRLATYPLDGAALRLLSELEALARESADRDRGHGADQDLLFSSARLQRLEGVREMVERLAGEMGGDA